MKRLLFIAILFLASAGLYSQRFLLVENQRSFKNHKIYPGDEITFRIPDEKVKIHDLVIDLNDSSIVFEMMGEVQFKEITAIYLDNYLVKLLQPFSLLAGSLYFGIDSFNRLINNDSPVILAETFYISAGIVAFSFALTPFRQRKLNTAGKWQLRVIDLNDYKFNGS